jgi:Flp pilus assembly protein TadD
LRLAPGDLVGKERLAGAHVKLGEKALERGRADEAIVLANAALETKPQDVDALALLGRAQLKANQLEDAAKTYGKLLELEPKNGEAQKALKLVQKKLSAAQPK